MPKTNRQPKVLLVTAAQRPGHLLSAVGHPCVQTPTLDELARSGVRFTNAYSETPLCVPARRNLMTGCPPRHNGGRRFSGTDPMPGMPTLAATFRDAGYQTRAVGKLHVYPQRDRIGFGEVTLSEEGRIEHGLVDDYELYLKECGHEGEYFIHGMGNNEYVTRPWHLAEEHHITNWATRELAYAIQRRDRDKPAFWYLSYVHPHPPLVPLECYLDMYREMPIDLPVVGDWAFDPAALPRALLPSRDRGERMSLYQTRVARRAFYALCTHVDHQLRVVIGTLREEGELDNTIILFTSDHGDMLGKHGLWAKQVHYEESARVPMILLGPEGDERVGFDKVDDRLIGLQDVMPTLLELAGIERPPTVRGQSMVSSEPRSHLYCEFTEGANASRMVRDAEGYKLIYYPVGNCLQLFDLNDDPEELVDLSGSDDHAQHRDFLIGQLIGEFYGSDEEFIRDGVLVGLH